MGLPGWRGNPAGKVKLRKGDKIRDKGAEQDAFRDIPLVAFGPTETQSGGKNQPGSDEKHEQKKIAGQCPEKNKGEMCHSDGATARHQEKGGRLQSAQKKLRGDDREA